MPRYDDTFVDRFLEPWNRHDVDGALAVMTDDCVWPTPPVRPLLEPLPEPAVIGRPQSATGDLSLRGRASNIDPSLDYSHPVAEQNLIELKS